MKKLVLFGVVIASCAAVAAQNATNVSKRAKKNYAEMRRAMIARQGGEIEYADSRRGKVAIVNKQTRLSEADCEKVVQMFAKETKFNIVLAKSGEGAKVTLTIIDDPKEPKMLLAPDDHYGTVNLAKLMDDLPSDAAKAKFFPMRARKHIAKALSLMLGGGASQFPGNLMNAATSRDLDLLEEQLPVDMLAKYDKYLRSLGATPEHKTTYRRACHEGWAPAPTNDVQKAIWDKVHAIPTKPMKIEFDPKKGR